MIHIASPQMGPEEKQAVLEVLDSGMIAQGPRVEAFEKDFAEMCGVKHAVATASGTTALHTALLAHGLARAMKSLHRRLLSLPRPIASCLWAPSRCS